MAPLRLPSLRSGSTCPTSTRRTNTELLNGSAYWTNALLDIESRLSKALSWTGDIVGAPLHVVGNGDALVALASTIYTASGYWLALRLDSADAVRFLECFKSHSRPLNELTDECKSFVSVHLPSKQMQNKLEDSSERSVVFGSFCLPIWHNMRDDLVHLSF